MTYTEKDIVHEVGKHWVLRKGIGHYQVFQAGVTHSKLRATFSFLDDAKGREYAIREAEKREVEHG